MQSAHTHHPDPHTRESPDAVVAPGALTALTRFTHRRAQPRGVYTALGGSLARGVYRLYGTADTSSEYEPGCVYTLCEPQYPIDQGSATVRQPVSGGVSLGIGDASTSRGESGRGASLRGVTSGSICV